MLTMEEIRRRMEVMFSINSGYRRCRIDFILNRYYFLFGD